MPRIPKRRPREPQLSPIEEQDRRNLAYRRKLRQGMTPGMFEKPGEQGGEKK